MNALVDPGAIATNIFGAFQQGQQARQQTDHRNALAQYATNPSPEGLAALAPFDPQFVMGERGRMEQADQAKQQQQQNQLPIMGRLLDHATDENSYQQALRAAQRYGLDVSQAPPQFDPNWVAQTKLLVAAVQEPAKLTATMQEVMASLPPEHRDPNDPVFIQAMHGALMKTIPYQAGGGVASFDPNTQQVTPLVVPNPGNMPAGAPVGGGDIPPPPPGFTLDAGGPGATPGNFPAGY